MTDLNASSSALRASVSPVPVASSSPGLTPASVVASTVGTSTGNLPSSTSNSPARFTGAASRRMAKNHCKVLAGLIGFLLA
jgi:hypothetical protein